MDNKSLYLNELISNELRYINGRRSIWFYVGVYEGVYVRYGAANAGAAVHVGI